MSHQTEPEIGVKSSLPVVRRHDLDALRGAAMLLGIVVHALPPFVIGWWQIEDTSAVEASATYFDELYYLLHGFRMPLFFLISGYFTAMMWQRKGQGATVKHRAKRVLLPLILSFVVILPATYKGSALGIKLAERNATDGAADVGPSLNAGVASGSAGDVASSIWETALLHLWFLWFLWLLFLGTALVWTVRERWPRIARIKTNGDYLFLSFVISSFVLFQTMTSDEFGPDTSNLILPRLNVLAFYGCFFAAGAVSFGKSKRTGVTLIDSLGKYWRVWAGVAVGSFLFGLIAIRVGGFHTVYGDVGEAMYSWSATFALIGLFGAVMNKERFWVRYLSDSTYWLYLAHLGLIYALQGAMAGLPGPPLLKIVVAMGLTTAILLASYPFIRYSPVGRLLNGPRSRASDQGVRLQIKAREETHA